VGAGTTEDDGGYAAKVMAEQDLLKRVAAGQNVPATVVPIIATVAQPAQATPTPVVAPAAAASESTAHAAAPEQTANATPDRERVALAP
ncbi:MAG TPA: lytic transglycosylase domain-containing protein, partial [Burkholderiaceae bacterium]|nr:lytic transglycosylase domain-containing protein [Burkholderiaceae bacterium]